MRSMGTTPTGYQQVTGISAATALTVPADSSFCIIQCSAQPCRWRDDGTSPTATVGMHMSVNDVLEYDGNLGKIKFIEETSGCILNVSYYS